MAGWLVDRMGGKDAWWLWRKQDELIIIYEMVWNGLKKREEGGGEGYNDTKLPTILLHR